MPQSFVSNPETQASKPLLADRSTTHNAQALPFVSTAMSTRSPLDQLTAHAKPALHLVAAEVQGGFSRIGGRPDLPQGVAWPRWKDVPLGFVAQVNLAEVTVADTGLDLPKGGCLWFFYVADQSTWGFDPADAGSWRVLFELNPENLVPAAPPHDLPDGGEYAPVAVSGRAISLLPSMERAGIRMRELDDGVWDALHDARDRCFEGLPKHQIGGYPEPVQGDSMELECQLVSNGLYCGNSSGYHDPRAAALAAGAREWKLLLQVDTDDASGMMWGDCGMLYFWIREADLAKRDFSRVWMILQCS